MGKGPKIGQCYTDIGQCYTDFIEFKDDVDKINVFGYANFSVDPIKIMCKRENYEHLSDEEFLEVS